MFSEELKIQFTHTFYFVSIILSSYIFGAFPEKFCYLHALKVILYLVLRFYSFKKRKFHYYMCDFCYLVNLFSIYVSIFDPYNLALQKTLFVVANGPLAISVLLFKNKIVLHSFDHNTSTFIHISAMLLSYVSRWHVLKNMENINVESWLSLTLYGFCFYMIWAVAYGYMMFGVLRERTVTKGNMTMFDWATEETVLSKLKNISSNEKVQQFIYMMIHAAFVSLFLLCAPFFWYNQLLHFVYAMVIITMAFWNGSYFYAKKILCDDLLQKNK
jgi:hypothetical protein